MNESTLKKTLIFSFASVVQFYGGSDFYRSAFSGLKNRIADMNLLVVIGTSAAYFYSLFVLLFPDLFPEDLRNTYFDGAAAIITFVLLGRYLESRSKNKATDFMKKLLSLKPQRATILVDGKEITIPAENIVKGDIVIVRAGEKIPVDGVVVEGEAEVDQSMVTGESVPEVKKAGMDVIGGTINLNGTLKIKALRTGKDTFLSQMIKMLSEAQERKPPVGRLADRIVSVFVPVILMISVITFDAWYLAGNFEMAFISAISVLIVACPCALGIATPIAVVVSVGKGAKEGILIKNPEIIEKIKEVNLFVFDKTGTLTEGKPSVIDKKIYHPDLLKFAYPVLKNSSHPVAQAVLKYIPVSDLNASDIKTFPGKGIRGRVNEKDVVIGNRIFLSENGFQWKGDEKGTEVIIGVDGKVVSVFYLEDRVKEESYELIQKLKNMGVEVALLTGDKKTVGEKLCKELSIDRCYCELLPEDKFRLIKKFQKEGKKVAFLGDGINDAPSMAVSDVGIAVLQATDLAKESGDVILLKQDLKLVLKVINLSKKTYSVIKQNLFWAYIYNLIGIPLAAGVLFPFFGILLKPIFAGMAMSFSSVSVVANSLRLQMVNLEEQR